MVDAASGGGLEGYAILVTGGGSGIGLACAARLAADGAAVTISGRHETVLADAAQRIGATVAWVAGDPGNLKVTYPADLQILEAMLR